MIVGDDSSQQNDERFSFLSKKSSLFIAFITCVTVGVLLWLDTSSNVNRGRSINLDTCEHPSESSSLLMLKNILAGLDSTYGRDTLKRAISSSGQGDRMRSLYKKLSSGQPIQLSVVGGSVSAGASLYGQQKTFSQHLIRKLNVYFPVSQAENVTADSNLSGNSTISAGHNFLPVCLPSSGSYVFRYCLDEILRVKCIENGEALVGPITARNCSYIHKFYTSDLILLDFAANDYVNMQDLGYPGGRLSEEEVLEPVEIVLRKLLAMASKPVVLFVYIPRHDQELPLAKRMFASAEHSISKVAGYYGTPSVSVMQAFGTVTPTGNLSRCPQCNIGKFLMDVVHPTDAGHSAIADLILYWLALDLTYELQRGDPPDSSADSQLPDALYKGSLSTTPPFCKFGTQWNVSGNVAKLGWSLSTSEARSYVLIKKHISYWRATMGSRNLSFVMDFEGERSKVKILMRRSSLGSRTEQGATLYLESKMVGHVNAYYHLTKSRVWYLLNFMNGSVAKGPHLVTIEPAPMGIVVLAIVAA